MISLILIGHEFVNEVQTITQTFYPNESYKEVSDVSSSGMSVLSFSDSERIVSAVFEDGVKKAERISDIDTSDLDIKQKKHLIKKELYNLLKEYTGYTPAWGMLTGIRPAKAFNIMLDEGIDVKAAEEFFSRKYDISADKVNLCRDVALKERRIISESADTISVYIGIPFCPTRCLYCSFAAYPMEKFYNRVDNYIEALIKELEFLGEYSRKFKIRSLYIGGGTPTSLNESQFYKLLKAVESNFNLKETAEYTVEAGRPDSVTREKLKIMKDFGVSRISINPQTMNDETLKLIGRNHTVSDIKTAFKAAREEGHNNINMDLILGLPGENTEMVEKTMEEVSTLNPESITVHTLAVKRASRLKENLDKTDLTKMEEIEKMLEISRRYAHNLEMEPYYMYRQKNMLGNFENVGYSKPGFECIYNVDIMEEKQSILAAGAGASTKIVDAETGRIERVFNVKDVDEYIKRIDEMIERKRRKLL